MNHINIKRYQLRLFLTCILLTCCPLLADATFKSDFSDGLNGWGEPFGHWLLDDGELTPRPGYGTARLPFADPDISDFTLSWQVRFDQPGSSSRFYLTVDRGEGYWMVTFNSTGSLIWSFNVEGRKAGMYHSDVPLNVTPGQPIPVTMTAKDGKLSLTIDDKHYILGPASGKGAVRFNASGHVAIDNVLMRYDTGGRTYPNRQLNGSFEYATNADVPDYWTIPGRWTRMNHGRPLEALHPQVIDTFKDDWQIDYKNPYVGKQSLRVRYPSAVASCPMWLPPGKQGCTASVYLRSDRPQMRVRLAIDGRDRQASLVEHIVTVGQQWQRVSIGLADHDGSPVSICITPQQEGLLWLDAVQLEAGRTATEYGPSWYDSGFSLPQFVEHVIPPVSYSDPTTLRNQNVPEFDIAPIRLVVEDAAKATFTLESFITQDVGHASPVLVTTTVEALGHAPFIATQKLDDKTGNTMSLRSGAIHLPSEILRVRVTQILTDLNNHELCRISQFMDVPQPLRIYPEFSHYSSEKSARMAIHCDIPDAKEDELKLELVIQLALHHHENFGRHAYALNPTSHRQLVDLPIRGNGWMHQTPYEVVARVTNQQGKLLATAKCDLKTLPPQLPDVRINYLNRGLYLNGEPYLPYGVYFTGKLPDTDQLRGYRQLGFDFIGVLGHRSKIDDIKQFLSDCSDIGLWVNMTQLSRKYGMASPQLADQLRGDPALILLNPVDETGQPNVYEHLAAAQHVLPAIPSYVNENTAGYNRFSKDLRGFPGPIISIDRYPLISQPYGWPQTSTDVNGIYSVEKRIERMDRDGKRTRKPLHMYLQAAEHTSREPSEEELRWLTYINLVNHCMAFTYFAGIPQSQIALETIMQLNHEVQTLKPALFSVEPESQVKLANEQTQSRIRVLAKRHGNELTLICINRGMSTVNAELDLKHIGGMVAPNVDVIFEDRHLSVSHDGLLADRFEPLARHVYRLRIQDSSHD